MEEKKPVTPQMARYIEIDAIEKSLKAEKEDLRASLFNQLSEGRYDGISYSSRRDIRLKKEPFYAWVEKSWPGAVRDLTVNEIDPEKFERAYVLGHIVYDEIPEECYSDTEINVISIAANRKKATKA